MVFVHCSRLAAVCAALAFGLLPCVAASAQSSARRVKTAQTLVTPVFENTFTRTTLGTIPNLNDQVAAQARMTPGPDSHMVVMGANTDVWCPPGKFIELAPNLKIEGFTPVTVTVFEGNNPIKTCGVDNMELLRVDPPTGGVNHKTVYVKVFDAQSKWRLVMQCHIRAHIANPTIAALDYKGHDEKCGFAIADRQMFKTTCLYMGDMYLGQVEENAGQIEVDERLLPPGKYSCQMVGQNSDDIFVPGASREFTVPARYTIQCADASQQIVIGEHDAEKLKVTITRKPGLSIKKTCVYIAGNPAGEVGGESFTVALPTHDVPTGRCFIEVVGIGEDGVEYPVESLPINIKNDPWDQRLHNMPEYVHAEQNNDMIDKLWQQVCYNLTRAKYSPDIFRDYKTFSLEKITEHFVVGPSAEFKAEAARAYAEMAHLQLVTANLYRFLKIRSSACSMYKNVVREVGLSSPDGEAAKTALDTLRKERATTL